MSFDVFQMTKDWLAAQDIPNTPNRIATSTNDLAKADAFSRSEPFVVYLADQQTKGRGRNDNSWQNSGEGTSLNITFSVQAKGAPQPITSPLVGLYLNQSLTQIFPKARLSLKAPNDIYLEDRKLAGILVEVVQRGDLFRLVIGIGLNVFSKPSAVPTAIAMSEKCEVTAEKWVMFLNLLTQKINDLSASCEATHLQDEERDQLLRALNRSPFLKEKLVQVSPFGDLISKTGTIAWRTL